MKKCFFLIVLGCKSFAFLAMNSTPVTISQSGGAQPSSRVACDAVGHRVAVWQELVSGQNTIQMAYSSDYGNSWSTPTSLCTPGDFIASPSIAMNSTGQGIVMWSNYSTGSVSIQLATFTGFGTSFTVTTLESSNEALSPKVAINSSGEMIAIWYQDYHVKCASSASAFAVQILSTEVAPPTLPRVVLDDDGNAIATWIVDGATNGNIFMKSSTDGGVSWSVSSTNITQATNIEILSYDIVLESSGHVVLAWSNDRKMYASTSSDYGAHWTPHALVDSYNTFLPSVAMNSYGNTIVTWYYGSTVPTVAYIQEVYSSDFGASWSVVQNLTPTTESGVISPQVVMDDYGHAAIGWSKLVDFSSQIQEVFSSDYGHTFSSIQNLSPSDANTYEFYLSLDTSGRLLILWSQASSSIKVQSLLGNFLIDITSSSQQKIRFLTQIDLVNSFSWTPIPYASYKIYSPALLTQTSDYSYLCHQQKKGQTYLFSWVNKEGQGSETTSFTSP